MAIGTTQNFTDKVSAIKKNSDAINAKVHMLIDSLNRVVSVGSNGVGVSEETSDRQWRLSDDLDEVLEKQNDTLGNLDNISEALNREFLSDKIKNFPEMNVDSLPKRY